MRTPSLWLGLSLMILANFVSQSAASDPPAGGNPRYGVVRQVVFVDSEPAPPAPGFFKRFLNRHGMACSATHNDNLCTNFWADFRFIFGSCRTFYGQGCTPTEPCHAKHRSTRP